MLLLALGCSVVFKNIGKNLSPGMTSPFQKNKIVWNLPDKLGNGLGNVILASEMCLLFIWKN